MKIGFVGAGAITEHHLGILGEQPDVEVAAVCDIDGERAQVVAERAGASAFTRWEEMLAAGGLDALFVCTPPMHHAAPAIAAFEHGLAGLPREAARSLAGRRRGDRRGLAGGAERSARWAISGARWTSCGQLRTLLGGTQPGLLVSRSFGPTEGARHDLEQGAAWFADPAISGGLLFELASHDIDLQIALAGPVESVQATAASGLLALAGRPPSRAGRRRFGAPALRRRRHRRLPRRLEHRAVARRSTRSTSRPRTLHSSSYSTRSSSSAATPAAQRSRVHGSEHPRLSTVTRFLDAARRSDPAAVPCTPADALATLRALLACEQAIASGERVSV